MYRVKANSRLGCLDPPNEDQVHLCLHHLVQAYPLYGVTADRRLEYLGLPKEGQTHLCVHHHVHYTVYGVQADSGLGCLRHPQEN